MDVQGVPLSTTNSMNVQGVYPFPPPTVWTCRVYTPFHHQQYERAGCHPFHRQQYGRAGCTSFDHLQYGHAGCTPFHHLQFGHSGCTPFHHQQYERAGCHPFHHLQFGHSGCIPFHHLQYGRAGCILWGGRVPSGPKTSHSSTKKISPWYIAVLSVLRSEPNQPYQQFEHSFKSCLFYFSIVNRHRVTPN